MHVRQLENFFFREVSWKYVNDVFVVFYIPSTYYLGSVLVDYIIRLY